MQVILTVTEGPHAGKAFPLDRHEALFVGRSPEAHIPLPRDGYLSRLHFLLEVNPPLCRLVDMGRHGTRVNGQPVSAADLRHGDEIRAGQTTLRVHVLPAPEPFPETLPLPPAPNATELLSRPPLSDDLSPGPAGSAGPVPFPPIPGFEPIRELGRGAMGVVYLARRAEGDLLAVKTLRAVVAPTREVVLRFLREADILRQLDHPRIVSFREVGEAAGALYLVMDYVEGVNGQTLLRREGPLAVGRAVGLVCQVLEALGYAHARGFVHRDVKPANVLVTGEVPDERATLTDFGLSRVYQGSQLSGLTFTGSVGGTPGFIPPEQVLDFRSAKPPADQYAAAATLYRLLTDRPLYDTPPDDRYAVFRLTLEGRPTPVRQRRPEIPEGLASAIHRALERDPAARFPDVAAFRAALLPFLDVRAPEAEQAAPPGIGE